MTNIHFERSTNHDEAWIIFRRWVHEEKLKICFRYKNEAGEVSQADLLDHDDNILSAGAGKGKHHQLGAVAEAIEHSFSGREINFVSFDKVSSHNIANQPLVKSCGILQNLHSLNETSMYSCQMYQFGSHPSNFIKIPVMLINPWFDQIATPEAEASKFLLRYTSNSGSAIGITLEDALLHAINEVIERHYLSHLFMQACGLESNISFQEVDKNNLPEIYKNQIKSIHKKYRCRVITSKDFCNVSFCAVIASPIIADATNTLDLSTISHVSSGASLKDEIALERATSEMLQIHYLTSNLDIAKHIEKYKKLTSYIKKSKKLHPLQHFDTFSPPLCQDTNLALNDPPSKLTTRLMIDSMVKDLVNLGYYVFYRIKTDIYDPFSVVHVYIPGLERYHHIREGLFVTPQSWLKSLEKSS